MLLDAAATDNRMAQALLLRQMLNLSKAVYDAAKASGDARRAEAIETVVHRDLAGVVSSLPTPGAPEQADNAVQAARTAQQGQAKAGLGSPVPNRLEPERRRRAATPTTGRSNDQGRD